MEKRGYWLSFVDDTGFKGCCQVLVTEENAAEALVSHPLAFRDPWLAAALTKTHRLGINPGGEVASVEFPADFPTPHPFDVLMSKAHVERYDAASPL